jgi:hypothetical protein
MKHANVHELRSVLHSHGFITFDLHGQQKKGVGCKDKIRPF